MSEDSNDHLPAKPSGASDIEAFLKAAHNTPVPFAGGGGGRLMFAMDATASRENSWAMAARIQGGMFEATRTIGGLQVQLAFFRGFDEFKVSSWLSEPDEIHRLMSSVFCMAGQTQLDKVFKHARNEATRSGVRAVVYVGDSFEENIDGVGQVAGELGILGVPVFLFHEGDDPSAHRAFEHFAKLSGGACVHFDASSPDVLKQLLGAVAVFAAGGRGALDEFAKVEGGVLLQITDQMRGAKMISLFIFGIALLIGLLLLSRWYVTADPKTLVKGLKWIAFTIVVVGVAWLAVTGKLWAAVAALPAILAWFLRMFTGLRYAQMFARLFGLGGGGQGWQTPGGDPGTAGQGSDVRTRFVQMHLDHATGHMSGLVLAGKFSGRTLDSLSVEDLQRFFAEVQTDPDSVRIVESYLDRRAPGWRTATPSEPPPNTGNMSREEALKVLGLSEGASVEDIKTAHRRLMSNLHPDKGGSDYLAQQINRAKDVLLD